MIRELSLVCGECGKPYDAQGKIYYRDNFKSSKISETILLCGSCIEQWKQHWQIKDALFLEKDFSTYVTITLMNGAVYELLDCSAMDDVVVTSEEIPQSAQRELFRIYKKWDLERKKSFLKECTFKDEFMRTSFSCETYGGEKFYDIAFRFNMKGRLETEKPVPEYIIEQIITAWKIYENQKLD